jgi:hypothetical protein
MLTKFPQMASFFSNASPPLPSRFWEGILMPVVVLAVVVITLGFLFLVGRLSWAAREYVLTCRERQRAHRKLVEMMDQQADRLENEALGVDQLWSASAALSAC